MMNIVQIKSKIFLLNNTDWNNYKYYRLYFFIAGIKAKRLYFTDVCPAEDVIDANAVIIGKLVKYVYRRVKLSRFIP